MNGQNAYVYGFKFPMPKIHCTWSIQVSPYKRLPLFLKKLTGDQASGASIYVTCLKKRRNKHYIASICQIFHHLKEIRPNGSGKKNSVFASHLPPVGVLLVHYMKNVSFRESQTRLFTRDQVIRVRIVVEMWLQIHLKGK